MTLTPMPQCENTELQSNAKVGTDSQKLTTTLSTIPILRSWAVKIQEEELLPNEWQKRMVRRRDESLVGPTINEQPLEGRDDGEFQLSLGFLQKRQALSNHVMTITANSHFLSDSNEMLNMVFSIQQEKRKVI